MPRLLSAATLLKMNARTVTMSRDCKSQRWWYGQYLGDGPSREKCIDFIVLQEAKQIYYNIYC